MSKRNNKSNNTTNSSRVISLNRRAYHDHNILETFEAGLALTGTEIKSVRQSKIDIQHSFARVQQGEMWLLNAHVAPYAQGNIYNHEPTRARKLLLHRKEIGYLAGTTAQKGLTLIPLRVYIKKHVAKVQIGLARGKKLYDKRQTIIDRDQEREAGRLIRNIARGQ